MSNPLLTSGTVLHLAQLARLELPADELPKITADLEKILGHVRSLDAVDTTGVEATAHVFLAALPLREDEPGPSLDREEVLGQAPRHADEGFAVPTFVEG
jgi:aspartyl-tRNA(Asn)/glutamyl-tRNA(Gln) amidotransferase subunit C